MIEINFSDQTTCVVKFQKSTDLYYVWFNKEDYVANEPHDTVAETFVKAGAQCAREFSYICGWGAEEYSDISSMATKQPAG
jgi:hypothetical protein